MESIAGMKSLEEFMGWSERLVEGLQAVGRRSRRDNAQRLLDQADAYMQRHLSDKDLTMQSVCDEQGMSVSYLSQLFKKHMGTTFVKHLTSLRMERAKEHLSLYGSPIIEVAEACGYRDVYYFSHCFRKYVGLPPKRYREANQ